jgi:hypothetical protein
MLSRAARRSVQNHRWNTWRLAPVGVSLAAALMVGLFASRFFVAPEVNLPPEPPVAEFDDSSLETESAVWAHASAFDDALSLGPEEAERFRALLENETLLAQGENPPELTQ